MLDFSGNTLPRLLRLCVLALSACAFSQAASAQCTNCPQWFIDQCHAGGYDYSIQGDYCVCGDTPILIDTKGRGFKLSAPSAGVVFDLRADGNPRRFSWPLADTGNAFLAMDRNENGTIDDGRELFGGVTAQPPSQARHGFAALAEFDKPENGGNGDGRIDGEDAGFASLLLWIDENRDGVSQPGELFSPAHFGIASFSLDYKIQNRRDRFGNLFRYRAEVSTRKSSDGGRSAWDVFLKKEE